MKPVTVACLLGILLAGCGQKGPLYRPGQQPAGHTLPASGSSKQHKAGAPSNQQGPTITKPDATPNTSATSE